MTKITQTDKMRFYTKIAKVGDCHIWQASKRPAGYGIFSLQGVHYSAHRIAYALAYPEVEGVMLDKRPAKGMRSDYVLHSCDVPSCVNPDHLRLGTSQDNARDASKRGRGVAGKPTTPKGGMRGSGVKDLAAKVADGPAQIAIESLLKAKDTDA